MANNITIKDAANADKTVKTTDNAGVHTPHHNIDTMPAVALDAATLSALETVNAVVSGSVSLAAALPAGANNIGDVDITSFVAGAIVEVQGDAAHDAAAAGNPVLAGAYASAGAPPAVSADGDAVRLWADLSGRLQVGDGGATLSVDDAGGSLTVDGSVGITGALPAGANNIGDVDILSVVPGTGATNLGKAEDAGHADGDTGIMALGVRRAADTSTALTDGDYQPFIFDDNGFLKVNIKAGAGSGGTAMTDDAAFTVGATSFTPAGGTFRSVRDLVEDNDGGAFAMTQRRAILSALETPDGDSAMDDANDAVRVNVVAGAGGGVSHTDDAAFTPAVSAVVPAAGMFDDALPDSVDEGDAGIVRMSANRNLYVRIRDNAGNERGLNIDASGNANTIVNNTVAVTGAVTANAGTGTFTVGDGGGSLTVDGSVSITGAVDTELPAAAALADNTANPAAPAVGAFSMVWDGAAWDRAPGTSADGLLVNLGANNDVTVTGTVTANAGTGTMNAAVLSIAAGTNNIGDVDVASVVPGIGAANLGKAEDAAHASGDVGVMSLAVRRDANTSLVDLDGDFAPLQVDPNGSLKVAITSGAGSGGTSMADDSAFTPGLTSVTPIGAMLDNTLPDSVDEGDVGVVRMSANRNMHVTLRDAAGNERGMNVDASGNIGVTDSGGSLTVDAPVGTPVNVQVGDGTRTASVRDTGANDALNVAIVDAFGNQITTFGGGAQYAEDAAHTSGDTGTLSLVVRKDAGGSLSSADGDYTPLQVDGNGALRVTGGGGGTEYTEDLASAADPVGQQLMARRRDSLGLETTADGDVTALNSTGKGELYVKHVDSVPVTDNGASLTVDGSVSLASALPAGTNNIGDVDVASIAAGEAHIGQVGTHGALVTATFSRPADTLAYVDGDAISNSTSAPASIQLSNVARKNGGLIRAGSLSIAADSTSFTGPIRVHFYNVQPTATNDNAAFTGLDQPGYLGSAFTVLQNIGGRALGMILPADMPMMIADSVGRHIYLLLSAAGGITPTSGMTFDIGLTVENG